jgi:spore germination cell wall hydrolase CwlJ-like protein
VKGWRGMIAVGMVIKNRIASEKYPSSYCSVVRQGFYNNGVPIKNMCQFSFWCDGKPEEIDDKGAWQESGYIADMLMSTEISVEGIEKATHYHAFYVYPKWAKTHMKMGKIGHHIFYRFASVN